MKTVRHIMQELGWQNAESAAKQRILGTIKSLGLDTHEVPSTAKGGGGKPAFALADDDADSLIDLLRRTPPPRPRLSPPAAVVVAAPAHPAAPPQAATPKSIGFKSESALTQELTGLTRRLKQILPQLGVDEYVLTVDKKAEGGVRCEVSRVRTTTEEIR